MDWNVRNPDLLACGYGGFDHLDVSKNG